MTIVDVISEGIAELAQELNAKSDKNLPSGALWLT
jgi:hypothetical protein